MSQWVIADDVFSLRCDDALRDAVMRTLQPFAATDRAPTFSIDLRSRSEPVLPFKLQVTERGDIVELVARGHYRGQVADTNAHFVLASASDDAVAFSLRNLLKQVFLVRLVARGGLALHGASIVHGGQAWVFFGPSGIGKTTLARCVPRERVLNDELTVITPDLQVHRTPYFGELGAIAGELHAPLARLYALAQSDEAIVAPLAASEAWRALLKHAAWFAGLPKLTPRLAESCLALAPRVAGRFGTPPLDADRFAAWIRVVSQE